MVLFDTADPLIQKKIKHRSDPTLLVGRGVQGLCVDPQALLWRLTPATSYIVQRRYLLHYVDIHSVR